MCVTDDTDDLRPVLPGCPETHLPTERAFPGPPVLREGLTHDDGAHPLGSVSSLEGAPLKQLDAHRLEVAGFDLIVLREDRDLSGRSRMVFDFHIEIPEP